MKKAPLRKPVREQATKAPKARPIRLSDLLAEGDVRGGSGVRIVFGQSYTTDTPRK